MGKPGSALQPGKRIDLGYGIAVETIEELDGGLPAGAVPWAPRRRRRWSASAGSRCRPTSTGDPPPTTRSATRPSTPSVKAASPHRPPGCTSPPSCSRRSRRAGVRIARARPRGGAGHVQAGRVGGLRPAIRCIRSATRFPRRPPPSIADTRARGRRRVGGRHDGGARTRVGRAERRTACGRDRARPG